MPGKTALIIGATGGILVAFLGAEPHTPLDLAVRFSLHALRAGKAG